MNFLESFIKTDKLKKLLKPLGIMVLMGIILFFLFDNILMPWYVQKGKTTKVPDVIGLYLEDAKQKIKEAGLDPKEAEFKSDKRYKVGTVMVQNPIAESEVKRDRGVYLTISGGEELVDVPNLKGKSLREAVFNLEKYNLKLGMITYEPSDEIFANTIIRQEIMAGARIKSGNFINVTVSQGHSTDKHPVPDVTLKTMNEAEKILTDGGFRIGRTTYQTNGDILPNTILEQVPRAGELLQMGQPIDLVIAQKSDKIK
jgi:eukaryotic-like serine/threonine-protein kinase